jgi:hypothetical protein
MVVVAPGRRASAPPNILLVTLDTTRADRKGAYGYHEARTPRLIGSPPPVCCSRARSRSRWPRLGCALRRSSRLQGSERTVA